jgi:hypothetical protein
MINYITAYYNIPEFSKMRTKKMVRHNKRHSRKKGGKGGKRSRGRRQFGGFWRSLITANENKVYKTNGSLLEPTDEKGIDVKYKTDDGERTWLIGGGESFMVQRMDGMWVS